MKLSLTVLVTAALALAAPAAASAASLAVTPQKSCYGTGETVTFQGTGFTPGAIVDFTRDGTPVRADPPITAGGSGEVLASLTVSPENGVETRTYAATDRTNPALTASVAIRVSELNVDIRPSSGRPSRLRRITAAGFTKGKVLWAHIIHRGSVRNLRIGRLRGACGNVSTRKRLFAPGAPRGRHTIYFDTLRKYRRGARVQRYGWRFRIFARPAVASASASRVR